MLLWVNQTKQDKIISPHIDDFYKFHSPYIAMHLFMFYANVYLWLLLISKNQRK